MIEHTANAIIIEMARVNAIAQQMGNGFTFEELTEQVERQGRFKVVRYNSKALMPP